MVPDLAPWLLGKSAGDLEVAIVFVAVMVGLAGMYFFGRWWQS
ncbi:MAG: hypothetical protein ACYDCQ_19390 [Dehalococcoidia bacterium]